MEELEEKRRRRGPCIPLEQRMYLHNEVLELRERGSSYRELQRTIYHLQGVKIPISTIGRWVRRTSVPLGHSNKFNAESSPELAYIIGVKASDGCIHQGNKVHCYWFELRVTDYEFAAETGRCLAKLLGRKKPYQPRWSRSVCRWYIKASSVLLYRFLGQPLEELRPYIEHCKDCVAAFLRAFFDGEGSMSRRLTVYNTDRELLLYVQQLLLRYFGIETTGPHISQKAGKRFRDPRNGKTYRYSRDCYYLLVRAQGLSKFSECVAFTISRKQRILVEAIRR